MSTYTATRIETSRDNNGREVVGLYGKEIKVGEEADFDAGDLDLRGRDELYLGRAFVIWVDEDGNGWADLDANGQDRVLLLDGMGERITETMRAK